MVVLHLLCEIDFFGLNTSLGILLKLTTRARAHSRGRPEIRARHGRSGGTVNNVLVAHHRATPEELTVGRAPDSAFWVAAHIACPRSRLRWVERVAAPGRQDWLFQSSCR